VAELRGLRETADVAGVLNGGGCVTIILTDWPKAELIPAHLRGVSTKKLLKLRKQLFHTMMICHDEEAGGYVICYSSKDIEAELKFRKVPIL
jgi:hypothetical protein